MGFECSWSHCHAVYHLLIWETHEAKETLHEWTYNIGEAFIAVWILAGYGRSPAGRAGLGHRAYPNSFHSPFCPKSHTLIKRTSWTREGTREQQTACVPYPSRKGSSHFPQDSAPLYAPFSPLLFSFPTSFPWIYGHNFWTSQSLFAILRHGRYRAIALQCTLWVITPGINHWVFPWSWHVISTVCWDWIFPARPLHVLA